MTISHSRSKILFISTFPPVKCGIASFTQDLTTSIASGLHEDFSISICALDKKDTGHAYPFPVSMVMDSYNLTSCIETANKINKDPNKRSCFPQIQVIREHYIVIDPINAGDHRILAIDFFRK